MYETPIDDFYKSSDGNDYLPAWNRAMQSIDIPAGALSGRVPDGRALVFGPKVYNFSNTIVINRILTIRGSHGGGQFSPTRLRFPENKTGIHVAYVYEMEDRNGRGDSTVIEKINIESEGGDSPDAHGLKIRARVTVRDVRIAHFSGNGLNAVTERSSQILANGENGTTNTNSSLFDKLWVENCKQDNVFIKGANANQMLFTGLSVDGSENGWGVNDESFLGNTYIAPHCSYNAAGSYKSVGHNQAGMWISPYAEQDQLPAYIMWPSVVIGGIINFVPEAKPLWIHRSGFQVTFPHGARAENRKGASIVEGVLGSHDVGNVAFQFQSDGDPDKPYRLQFDPDDKRWWLTYANNPARSPIGFTTESSVESQPYPILPRGYYLGASPAGRWIKLTVASTQPDPNAPGNAGDQIYNTNPQLGGYVGWVYTGQHGWRPFGKID